MNNSLQRIDVGHHSRFGYQIDSMQKEKVDRSTVEEDEDEEFYETFKLTEMVLCFIGLRIFYEKRKPGLIAWLKHESFFIITITQLSVTVVAELIYFMGALGEDFLTVTILVTCIGFCAVGFSKMFVISRNRTVLQKQFEDLYELWPRGELSPEIVQIKKRCLNRLYYTITVFFWLYFILIILFNSDPLLSMIVDLFKGNKCYRKLPYFVKLPFDPLAPGAYQVVYLYLMWSGFISSLGIVAQDCLFQISCSHISMLLEVLMHDVRHMIPEDWTYSSENQDEEFLVKKFNKIIKRHQKLISVASVIEETYNFVIMVNIVVGTVIICLVGFQATIADAKQLIKFSFSTFSTLMQAFILSWYGNLLIDTSTGLNDAAYHCRWYDAGPRFKSTLRIFMLRTQKPLFVTAMKFSPISLKTFTSIASNSWSYFTLLRTVYDPQK